MKKLYYCVASGRDASIEEHGFQDDSPAGLLFHDSEDVDYGPTPSGQCWTVYGVPFPDDVAAQFARDGSKPPIWYIPAALVNNYWRASLAADHA